MVTLGTIVAECPDCPISRTVRELVFSDAFWRNAWSVVLPFLILVLVVRLFVNRFDGRDDDERGGA